MAQGLIVRLADGSEIGPLGRDDLRSWFEGGLISADSMVKRPDAARWTTLGQEIDVTLWRQLAGTSRAANRPGAPPRADAGPRSAPGPRPAARPAPAPRPAAEACPGRAFRSSCPAGRSGLRSPSGRRRAGWSVGVLHERDRGAEGAARRGRARAPLRRCGRGGSARPCLRAGSSLRPGGDAIAAPPQARVVLAEPSAMTVGYLVSESPALPYASLDEYLGRVAQERQGSLAAYQEKARDDASVGPFPARRLTASWKSGDDAFSERIAAWKEAWTYFALVTWTPQARESRGARAADALARGFSSEGQVGQRVQQALQRVIADVPHLSPRAAETLMGRSAAGVLEPPEVFRRSWDLASRGLFALDKARGARAVQPHRGDLPARARPRARAPGSLCRARPRARIHDGGPGPGDVRRHEGRGRQAARAAARAPAGSCSTRRSRPG